MWVVLTDAGVRVRQLDSHHVELTTHDDVEIDAGAATWTVQVKAYNRTLTPSIVHTVASHTPLPRILAVAPTISPAARAVATTHGWSVIATNPKRAGGPTGVLVRPDGRLIELAPSEADPSTTPEHPIPGPQKGRPGYGRDHVVRLLLAGRPLTQSDLADATGLTQPRISQTVRALHTAGLVQRVDPTPAAARPARWIPGDWQRLLDYWLSHYRGPGGTRTFWYGLDTAATSAAKVLEYLSSEQSTDRPRMPPPVLSGLLAADPIAPWVRPSVGIVYSPFGADLHAIGLTPAAPSDATVHLVVPADPGVWMAPGAWPELSQHPMADPTQVLWDLLHRTPVADADQAVQHLRASLSAIALKRMGRNT
ncbi:MAG TPA: MarR family transcriptional regulator [Nocardioidaceae bacterium]|nr:MarR family transcriptional regulator [Nocardioidaceae bacterium]